MKKIVSQLLLSTLRVTGLLLLIFWAAIGPLENWNLYYPNFGDFPKGPAQALQLKPVARLENVYFSTADGVKLNGWFVPPAKATMPTILFAHGNSGNIGDQIGVMQQFIRRGYGFFAFDYRGYGKSEGTPSEKGLFQDITAASDYLSHIRYIPPGQQIALGGSLGSAVVIDAATHIPFRAVIAYSTLTSAPAVADALRDSGKMGWLKILPLQRIMRQTYDSLSKVGHITTPLIIMHGDHDHMMPLSMPKALYAKAASPHKMLLIIPNAGHESVIYQGEATLFAHLTQLLAQTQSATGQQPTILANQTNKPN